MSRPKGAIANDRTIDAAQLRAVLKPIYAKLVKARVPEDRMPSNETLVSLILKFVDQEKINEWSPITRSS
jgi:hypothetical protein